MQTPNTGTYTHFYCTNFFFSFLGHTECCYIVPSFLPAVITKRRPVYTIHTGTHFSLYGASEYIFSFPDLSWPKNS